MIPAFVVFLVIAACAAVFVEAREYPVVKALCVAVPAGVAIWIGIIGLTLKAVWMFQAHSWRIL